MRTQAGRYALISTFVVAAPLTLWTVYNLRTPELWAGDELEVRVCRWCGGSGAAPTVEHGVKRDHGRTNLGRCPGCGGGGKVRVIVPGAHRPTHFKGVVVDVDTSHASDSYSFRKPRQDPGGPFVPGVRQAPGVGPARKRTGPSTGVIGGAKVHFENEAGKVVEIESNPYGMFNTKLAPGQYKVTITASLFRELKKTIFVPVLTEPIWLEEAQLIEEPESPAHAQSLYGLELIAALEKTTRLPKNKRDGKEPYLRVTGGTP